MSETTLSSMPRYGPWQRLRDALPPWFVCALVALVALLIPYMVLWVSMRLTIVLVTGILGLALVVTFPYVGLLLFLGLLYLRPEEIFPVLAGARMALNVSLLALGSWVINALLCRERFQLHLPAVRCFLGFLIVAIGSTALTGSGILTEVALELLKLLVLFVLIVHLVSTEARLRVAISGLVLFTTILGARTITQFQQGHALVQSDGAVRAIATGIFSDPNDLSLAMAMAMPLALGFGLGARHLWTRLWTLCTVPILIWTVFITDSRGGMLALAFSMFLYFRRKLGRAGFVLGALAVVALLAFGPSRLGSMSADEESAQGRVVAWVAGLQMFQNSPLWGVGKDHFVEYHHLTAHNSFVLCLAELGLLGAACWIGLFYFAFRDGNIAAGAAGLRLADFGLRLRRPRPESSAARGSQVAGRTSLSALLQMSLLTFMVGGFFLSRTYTPPLYVFLGLAVAAAQIEARASALVLPADRGRDWGRIAGITLGGVLVILLLTKVLG